MQSNVWPFANEPNSVMNVEQRPAPTFKTTSYFLLTASGGVIGSKNVCTQSWNFENHIKICVLSEVWYSMFHPSGSMHCYSQISI